MGYVRPPRADWRPRACTDRLAWLWWATLPVPHERGKPTAPKGSLASLCRNRLSIQRFARMFLLQEARAMARITRRVLRIGVLLAVAVVVASFASPVTASDLGFGVGATARVTAVRFYAELRQNVADLAGTFTSGASYEAKFLTNFDRTGGVERWGFPTSAIFEETAGTLTQYYQRGVVDWKLSPRGDRHTFQRRLAWDHLGGGLGGSQDQGVEPGLRNPNPGEAIGPWGHKVADLSVEGVSTGFADFFNRLGGVASFGYPKTDARRDNHPQAVLHDPARPVDSRIRQYFQAAVLDLHPESAVAPVKLRLLGDTLRNRKYPHNARGSSTRHSRRSRGLPLVMTPASTCLWQVARARLMGTSREP